MSNKTRSILKIVAVLVALLCVAMHLQWVIIPAISVYKFWLMVTAFALLLVASK